MDEIYFPQYEYTSITGNKYTPYTKGGKWFVIPGNPITFLHFVYLCKIPDDEALVLKLTYGG